MPKHLIIVGCGPKALAIAAKTAAIKEIKGYGPDVTIIEKEKVAANWTGNHGYTDGNQFLGTPPEKDIGFPYPGEFGLNVEKHILANFSWQAYLLHYNLDPLTWSTFREDELDDYGSWIDRGRRPPKHRGWADYLKFIRKKLGDRITVTIGAVDHISVFRNRWKVRYSSNEKEKVKSILGDGLVITGAGTPKHSIFVPDNKRTFDGKSFWENVDKLDVENLQRQQDPLPVVVIGSGETAASIAVALIEKVGIDVNVIIMNKQGAVFSRGESYDENRRFTEPGNWSHLDLRARKEFMKRTDRGVFSLSSKAVIDGAKYITHDYGDVERIDYLSDTVIGIWQRGNADDENPDWEASYVIDTTGFDLWWFMACMPHRLRKNLRDPTLQNDPKKREAAAEAFMERIAWDLSVTVEPERPKLHLPMLSSLRQGPGFPNLSCLGNLSERIVKPYCR